MERNTESKNERQKKERKQDDVIEKERKQIQSAFSMEAHKRQKEEKTNGEKEGKLQHSSEVWNSRVLQYSF